MLWQQYSLQQVYHRPKKASFRVVEWWPGVDMTQERWPALRLAEWQDTYATLHLWTQIVGKIRLALTPRVNHWWNVPLYLSARGLTTSAMHYGEGSVQIDFDFLDHRLEFTCASGHSESLELRPRSVADFYREVLAILRTLRIEAKIWPVPVELPDPIRFDQDETHKSYDPEYANRHW